MMITYHVALDKNGDGYVNILAKPTDPPNLLPDPVTFGNLYYDTDGIHTSLRLNREEFDYGTHYWKCLFLSTSAGMFAIGTLNVSSATPGGVPVNAGTTYTALVWMRDDSGHGGGSLRFSVYDGNNNLLATQTNLTLVADGWTQVAVTFTTGATVNAVFLAIERSAGAVNVVVDVAGAMLVAGGVAPQAFNSGDDLDDFISDDVLALSWRLGLGEAFTHAAAPTEGRVVVRNVDGRYAPEADAVPIIATGRRLRIRAQHDTTTTTLFTGIVEYVEPLPGDQGERTAIIHLCGPERELNDVQVLLPVQTDARADTVISAILASFGSRYVKDFEAGESSFAYVADNWDDGLPAMTPIRQVTEAERGRFYSDRLGRLVFKNRSYRTRVFALQATFADSMQGMTYTHGANMVNRVRVAVRPRSVGVAGSVLWTLETAQKIMPGIANQRRLTARLRDLNGRPLGALSVLTPVAYTDYVANTKSDGTGIDVTTVVSVGVSAVEGSAVSLTIQNNHSEPVYILPGTQLRGTPIIQGDPMLISHRDALSIADHGEHTLNIDLPLLVTAEEADVIAFYEMERRKMPFGMATTLTLDANAHPDSVLNLTLFDQITVQETQTGHNADYFIIAEAHTIADGSHHVTWTLEPLNPGGWWVLNQSRLGDDTRLGYRY